MAYDTGMMDKRVTFARRTASEMGRSGRDSGGIRYETIGTFWASETFNRGAMAMQAGAIDAYNTVMFRLRFTDRIDRRCILRYEGRWYEIQSFNATYRDNQIQITARELANQQINIV